LVCRRDECGQGEDQTGGNQAGIFEPHHFCFPVRFSLPIQRKKLVTDTSRSHLIPVKRAQAYNARRPEDGPLPKCPIKEPPRP
jgi:hypothetical protein